MEFVSAEGFINSKQQVDSLFSMLKNKISLNDNSACYLSRQRGGAEPNYEVSYSLHGDELQIDLIKPNIIVIGATVVNKQLICFTPRDQLSISLIREI